MSTEEELDAIQDDLAPYLPRSDEIEKLLRPAAAAAAELKQDISSAKDGLRPQTAESKEELSKFGSLIGIEASPNESVELYRQDVTAQYQQLTASGTPHEILTFLSRFLGVSQSNIELEQKDESATFSAKIPLQSIKEKGASEESVKEIAQKITAATYGIDLIGTGTLEYVTATEYYAESYDPQFGYATLDADGNVNDGGTYSANYTK